jgi:hypothetical protein
MDTKKVLPSITTAGRNADWRKAVHDLIDLGVAEASLFLTGLDAPQREELYSFLEKAQLPFRLPVIHARSDMRAEEYQLLRSSCGAERFNLHPEREWPLAHPLTAELKSHIFIENAYFLHEEDLSGYAGICLDLSHLEMRRRAQQTEMFDEVSALIQKYPVGITHLSAIVDTPLPDEAGNLIIYERHRATALSDLDYISGYPPECFADYVVIELTNPIPEQLAYKDHIEKKLGLLS